MKGPARSIKKGLKLLQGFIHKVKLPMVLSKRSLIHSDSGPGPHYMDSLNLELSSEPAN